MYRYFFLIFSLLKHFVDTSQIWHISQITLMQLYDLQTEHFDICSDYLNLEEKRLEELKGNLAAMYERHNYTNDSVLQFHINNMKAMKRIHYQLRKLEHLILSKKSTEVLKKINEHKVISDNQIFDTHLAMRRLQRFYMITASDMAAGRYKNRIIGDQMDACECYVMSKYCFKVQDMYCVTEWAIETYKKWQNYDQPKCVDVKKLHFYIISSSVYTGFDFTTLLNSNELQTSDDSEKFKRFFLVRHKDTNLLDSGNMVNTFGMYDEYYEFTINKVILFPRFRELCQYNAPVKTLTKYSKCRYQTKNSTYRLLMPFKEENVMTDPYIKIYHDVLYDNEISSIKNIASENMVTAEVSYAHETIVNEDQRSGQVCGINNDDTSKTLNARVETFTGYSTETAEIYQIANYGLGGHFIPHLDALGKYTPNPVADRILTVLFYMSDVPNDGSTVFPYLNIISPAEKGAALVFINLNMTDGSIHWASLHGACPILKGNKWIMTRWLTEEGQNLPYDWRNRAKIITS